MANYNIWLTYNANRQKLSLPVLPERFSVKNGSKNDSVDIAGLGEIVIMQSRPALVFSWQSFFPMAPFPGMKKKFIHPLGLIRVIEGWKKGDKPVRLIAAPSGLNLYCTIEDFSYYEQGGDIGTYYYSITLKEYREISMRGVSVDNGSLNVYVSDTPVRVENGLTPTVYLVKPGDNLTTISKSVYGVTGGARALLEANRAAIGANPNNLNAGAVLKVPAYKNG